MKKPITFVSMICSLLFLAAILVFASGIYIDKKNGTAKADARYEELLKQTKENFSANSYGTPEFSLNFIHAIGNINDFSSLKLEVNGTLVYSYPPSSFSLPSPELVKSYSDTVNVSGKNFTLRASIYLMTPGTIYNHSRFAFLMILIGTLIVGIFIVFTNNSESPAEEDYEIRPKKKREFKTNKESPAPVKEEPTDVPAKEESKIAEEPTPAKEIEQPAPAPEAPASATEEVPTSIFTAEEPVTEKAETPAKEEEKTISFDDFSTSSKDEEPAAPTEDKDFDDSFDIIDQLEQENQALSEDISDDDFLSKDFEEPIVDEPVFTAIDEPKEAAEEPKEEHISPVTKLEIQASLEEKLDEVIVSEPEATVALLKINGLDRGNPISQEIISILKDSTTDSPVFEYKADSYATIIKSDLQTVVDNFEEIYNKIADFLKNNNATNEVSVGISSASGRNVKAERVILEASQALDYASQDPDSPIVAFRANPEKYKEYIESNNSN